MPEERDAEMLGVPVFRIRVNDEGYWSFMHDRFPADDPDGHAEMCALPNVDPGRWHAEPAAVAIAEVVEAGKTLRSVIATADEVDDGSGADLGNYMTHLANAEQALWTALDNLDAALGGGHA